VAQVPLMLDESIYGLADIDKAAKPRRDLYQAETHEARHADALSKRSSAFGSGMKPVRQRRRLRSRLLDGGLHRAPDRQRRRNERLQGARAAFAQRLDFGDGAMRPRPTIRRSSIQPASRRICSTR
jgi:hypothetical protein